MIDSTRWACELGRCHMVDHQSSLNSSSSALDLLLVAVVPRVFSIIWHRRQHRAEAT